MITSKYMPAITAAFLCLALIACGIIVVAAGSAGAGAGATRVPEYEKRLFGDAFVTISIEVNGEEWQGLLDNAQDKEWIAADLIISGEGFRNRFSTIGIRTKGNSSLSRGMGGGGGGMGGGGGFAGGGGGGAGGGGASTMYSLQFKADKYIKGQTFYGLDTFCVNNMMGDSTYMKDYLAYEIMDFIGVATPLTNYAGVAVNGEDYGFGIMLERYDQAFLDRVYGAVDGQLYNVKISMGRRGDFEDMWQDVVNGLPNMRRGMPEMQQDMPEDRQDIPEMRQDMPQMFRERGELPDMPQGEGDARLLKKWQSPCQFVVNAYDICYGRKKPSPGEIMRVNYCIKTQYVV
ncbi:MAG: CotH kinase family protein [Oscillospiraceae bacterium]|nr:CotH kinase family protein [Oscillospiraceae bacterium]